MDCVIKSSNRPYMLDWTISSIEDRAGDSIDKIFVADDGTPSKYLDEILKRHPNVIILHSGRHFHDAQNLSRPYESMEPVFECWREAVRCCSGDYFLLLEDDIALARPMNFDLIEDQLQAHNILHYKLVEWSRNFDRLGKLFNDDNGETSYFGRPQFLSRASRNLVFRSLLLLEFSDSTFGFQLWRAARALHLHPRDQWLLNYQVYSMAGVIISKNWFLNLWQRPMTVFSERPSMELALRSMLQDASLNTGHIEDPALTKSYRSAARDNRTSKELDFSVDVMNMTLNEAWLHGTFAIDIGEQDLVEEEVLQLFTNAGLSSEFGQKWKNWYQIITNNVKGLGF